MSCMGGATAPLSSSSSESALGLLSDLATAWFSMDPLPSPPASGCLPVISSTAASTATETENTPVTCQIGGRTTVWTRWNTFYGNSLWTQVWSLDDWRTVYVAKNRNRLDSSKVLTKATYSQEVCISWTFPWAHPLERKDPAGGNNHRLFEFWEEKKSPCCFRLLFITSKYQLDGIKLLRLTVKHVGGGSSFIRTTAAGGTGKTPPGTGCKPGAVGRNTRSYIKDGSFYAFSKCRGESDAET